MASIEYLQAMRINSIRSENNDLFNHGNMLKLDFIANGYYPILLSCPTTSEVGVGGGEIEVKMSFQSFIIFWPNISSSGLFILFFFLPLCSFSSTFNFFLFYRLPHFLTPIFECACFSVYLYFSRLIYFLPLFFIFSFDFFPLFYSVVFFFSLTLHNLFLSFFFFWILVFFSITFSSSSL